MKIVFYIIFFILIAIFSVGSAFGKDFKGMVMGVTKDGIVSPLSKARVVWLNTKVGTLSDVNGNFSIKTVDGSKTFLVTYIGYQKDTIEINDFDRFMLISLKEELTTSDVVVTGQQPARLITESTIKSETITLSGLQKAACCNLSESFQTNPSVDVSYSDAVTGAKQIQLLGLQGVYIQFLTEKVPAMRGLSSNFGLEYIPGPWMESIQISKGSASVATGYESVSGQINIEFKKPDISEPFFLNLYANQQGRYEANMTSAVKFTDKLSTMLFAHSSFNLNKLDYNGDSFLDKPLTKQFNFINRWAYLGAWESQLVAKALYEDRQGGQLNYWPDKTQGLYGMDIKTQKYEIYAKNGFVFNTKRYSSLGTIISVTHYKLDSYFGKNKYIGEENSVYANFMYQAEMPFDSTEKYVVGVSFSHDNFLETRTKLSTKIEDVPGAYLEYTYNGIKDLSLMGGIRLDFHNLYGRFVTPRFHAKYRINEITSIGASVGKSYRVANVHAENIGMLATSRTMTMNLPDGTKDPLHPEEAWNYGVNASTIITLFDTEFTLNAEYYRTDFLNQVILDMDSDPNRAYFYNLNGKSYSNSVQFDVTAELFAGFTATTAYRLNDVKITINGMLMDKPLQSRNKAFINLAYTTPGDDWNFDFTAEYNGRGRIPNTTANPVQYQMPTSFNPFALLHGQIKKKFKSFDIYLGAENITDFKQLNPLISADNPFSKYFDTSLIWGPIVGRVIYLGARMSIK